MSSSHVIWALDKREIFVHLCEKKLNENCVRKLFCRTIIHSTSHVEDEDGKHNGIMDEKDLPLYDPTMKMNFVVLEVSKNP